jgi:hypothetical protein
MAIIVPDKIQYFSDNYDSLSIQDKLLLLLNLGSNSTTDLLAIKNAVDAHALLTTAGNAVLANVKTNTQATNQTLLQHTAILTDLQTKIGATNATLGDIKNRLGLIETKLNETNTVEYFFINPNDEWDSQSLPYHKIIIHNNDEIQYASIGSNIFASSDSRIIIKPMESKIFFDLKANINTKITIKTWNTPILIEAYTINP